MYIYIQREREINNNNNSNNNSNNYNNEYTYIYIYNIIHMYTTMIKSDRKIREDCHLPLCGENREDLNV